MNRWRTTALALMFVAGLTIPGAVMAHGTECRVVQDGLMIEASYDDGSPMSYCDVSVFRPGSPDSAFVTGTTSEDGRFSFVARAEGMWKIEVDDGMGHLAVMDVEVGPEGATGGQPSARQGRILETVTGVSVIFGLLGLYYIFRRKH
ncbi:MAG: hypothetical protein KAV42_11600 [Candidatus Krumholzibacteria bacterium]|nr:hypothetical protein [Candidatus Krumholzibacteria bacterium]